MKRPGNSDVLRCRFRWLLTLALPVAAQALDVNEWQFRQSLAVERAGIVKLPLPPATLDAARAGLPDLRLLDPAGREIACVIERAAPPVPPSTRGAESFRSALTDTATVLTIETGHDAPLAAVTLETPAPVFMKPARVEVSADGRAWQEVASAAPVFRQFGATQLRISFEPIRARHVRVTLDDTRTRPIPFSGARLTFAAGIQPAVTAPLPIRLVQREEFAGESVLTIDLGAKHVPLASLEFVTPDPLFTRTVSVNLRELREGESAEREIARGSIYRVAADGLEAQSQLVLPLDVEVPARELLLHIFHGDSPPLAVDEIRAQQRPVWLVFRAPEAGTYLVLTGNPDVAAPRYDLANLASSFRQTAPSALVLGAPERNAGYRRLDALGAAPLLGAVLDPAPWKFRKAVKIQTGGVQQLELDLDVLSAAKPALADLRLLRDGAQVPYLLERPALSRSIDLPLTPADDVKRPSVSRWRLALPGAGLPLTRITLTSSTQLFQRQIRIYEVIDDPRQGRRERTLANAEWSVTPGNLRPLAMALSERPVTAALFIETDNRDNPPIAIGPAKVAYPVARLLFRADAGPADLYYGNHDAAPARYDLALMAGHVLSAEKHIATLGAEEGARGGGWAQRALAAAQGGPLFWGVLSLVVIVLLFVIAKLLPKPPAGDSSG